MEKLAEVIGFDVGDLRDLIEPFVRRRLIVLSRTSGEVGASLEVAHEALLGAWPHLAELLKSERESLALRQEVDVAAVRWEASGRRRELWNDATSRLARAEELLASGRLKLTQQQRGFLQASRLAVRRRKRAERVAALSFAMLAVVAGLAFFQVDASAKEAKMHAGIAQENLLQAQQQTIEAERARGIADEQRRRAEAASEQADAEAQRAEASARRAEDAIDRFNVLAYRVQLDEALAAATSLYPAWPENVGKLEAWLRDCAKPLVAALPMLEARQGEFERPPDDKGSEDPLVAPRSVHFLRRAVRELVADLRRFTASDGAAADVGERLAWARSVHAASIDDHASGWRQSRAAIKRELGIDMPPQIGLVPVGRDPQSKLWEFVHLRSGKDPRALPRRNAGTGKLDLSSDHGMVFVLIPGGDFLMGAQKESSRKPNYYRYAEGNEQPDRVTLAPFFIGKHELTQAQWKRLTRGDEPSALRAGTRPREVQWISWLNPVENIDAPTADKVLAWHGLRLPTEAQWEFACRAKTTTPWCSGSDPEDLSGYANVSDEVASEKAINWGRFEDFNDGHLMHAPVGTFLPNGYGLHDMHGNVMEWCRDGLADYSQVQARFGDGLREAPGAERRVVRGGSFQDAADMVRSAYRYHLRPDFRAGNVGLRAARGIDMEEK